MNDQQTLDKSRSGWRLYLRIAGPVRGEGPKHHGNGGLRAPGFKRDPGDFAVCPTTRADAGDADDTGV